MTILFLEHLLFLVQLFLALRGFCKFTFIAAIVSRLPSSNSHLKTVLKSLPPSTHTKLFLTPSFKQQKRKDLRNIRQTLLKGFLITFSVGLL